MVLQTLWCLLNVLHTAAKCIEQDDYTSRKWSREGQTHSQVSPKLRGWSRTPVSYKSNTLTITVSTYIHTQWCRTYSWKKNRDGSMTWISCKKKISKVSDHTVTGHSALSGRHVNHLFNLPCLFSLLDFSLLRWCSSPDVLLSLNAVPLRPRYIPLEFRDSQWKARIWSLVATESSYNSLQDRDSRQGNKGFNAEIDS